MVLRLLAHNAEHWLSSHLNAYLRDDDEYRAIARETIIRGLAGTITSTPAPSPTSSPQNRPIGHTTGTNRLRKPVVCGLIPGLLLSSPQAPNLW